MTQYQSIFNKYSQNQNMLLPFNELMKDFNMIKPTFNPILDICIIKTLGSYITNTTNYQKWQICPNLINEIHMSIDSNIIEIQAIIDIVDKARKNYEQPDFTINKVYYYISDCIKDSLNMNNSDDVLKYFEMKSEYKERIDMIKLKYSDTWKEIEKQYETIIDVLLENFRELENDLNFEATTELIDSIGVEASKEVEKLINKTAILIKENNYSPQIKIDFDKMMDQIYEKVILSKNFDKYIHDIIVDMYGVDKSIHRMSLSLENCVNVLNICGKI